MSDKYLVIDSRPYGMFSIFLHTIDCLKWCEDNEYLPYIRWNSGRVNINLGREGANEASKFGNPAFVKDKNNFSTDEKRNNNTKYCLYAVNENDNVWNYYFEPINDCKIENILQSDYKINDIFMCGELDFNLDNKFLIKNLHSYDALKIWSLINTKNLMSHRIEVNETINKYVKLTDDINKKLLNFHDKKFNNCDYVVGVHVRGTDKKTEYPFKELTINDYISKISEIIKINKNKKYKIYIASDNNESIKLIANHFGKDNIICFPSMRMNSYSSLLPIHLNENIDKKLHGEQTIIEMLLLSRCDYIIGTDSNFTAAACYFNPKAELIYLDRKYGI